MQRSATIWSEGTRIAADLFVPDDLADGERRAAVVLCHGWGGRKQHLSSTYAPAWAKRGLVCLTFDYRGWGESDGKLIRVNPAKELAAGVETAEVRVIREVVDPFDQILDIQAALDWLVAEPCVDTSRIGIWGSSFGGGHVITTAATDDRVKCVVAQVGGYGMPAQGEFRDFAQQRATQKARGELDPPIPQGIDKQQFDGTPDYAKMARYRPRDDYAARVRVPTLIIDAEREELMDPREHGRAVYEIVSRNAKADYKTFDCTHYEIYDKFYPQAAALACDWFLEHLA